MRHWTGALFFTLAAACSDGNVAKTDTPTDAGPGVPACATGPDYICDVQPLLQTHCVSCHQSGGITPFALDNYETASALAASLSNAATERRMPPWPPEESAACPPLKGSRSMPAADIETLRAWAEAGAPLGVEGSVAPAPQSPANTGDEETLGEPDTEFSVGMGYIPDGTQRDDYRCFIVDPGLTQDTWLHGYEVTPSNRAIVHHVLIYSVRDRDQAELQAWDDQDPGLGFECFGAPSPGIPMTLGGWVPGQRPQTYRRGDGAWIPAGAKLVVQLHYNLESGSGTDETSVKLHYVDGVPFREVGTIPYPATDFAIPAGNASYSYTANSGTLPEILFSNDLDLRIEGVAPHMHQLGTAISFTLVPPGGTDQCLIRVNDWDFNWQGFYLFDGEEPMAIPVGSTFNLTCSWDNSEENQRMVNGVRVVPKRVTWGEGTGDEMCLAYMIVSGNQGWMRTLLDLIDSGG